VVTAVQPFEAAVFDMDGLLTASESRWRIAEREMATLLGLNLTDADFDRTMGVRMRDVAALWFEWEPWDGPSADEVADHVVDRVVELTSAAVPLPGVMEALDSCQRRGLSLGLCSSSDTRLIAATLAALGLSQRFEVVHSAEADVFGKPHPEPYLETARLLGVDPKACLVFEDSVGGCISAKAAGMRVVAVPDPAMQGTSKFGFCDIVLEHLGQLSDEVFDGLECNRSMPSLARPRFHLAFPVDDLGKARWFYGEILGCAEGRSADVWVDFNLWGHQIVAHLDTERKPVATNAVDGEEVPASHFGILLQAGAWHDLVSRLQTADVTFLIEPQTRFAGLPGEQLTCFVLDPSGNALEFKAFSDDRAVFAT
jgi:HAD superfamily hydrolase (TIGR01509 family)